MLEEMSDDEKQNAGLCFDVAYKVFGKLLMV